MGMHRLFWSLRRKLGIKSMRNKKMLIAPILAVALVLSLTAAVSYLPLSPQAAPQKQPSTVSTPASTSTPKSTPPSYSAGASSTQMPSPAAAPTVAPTASPTAAPTAVPAVVSQPAYFLPVLFVIAAVVLGVVAVQVLFREKELGKELSEGE